MRKAFLTTLAVAGAALGLMAPSASAAQMDMMIREYYPGGVANDSYLVLQAYSPNQNATKGHTLKWTSSAPTGISTNHSYTFPNDVTNTATQATILIADDGYTGSVTPDFVVPNFTLYPGGGMLCTDYEYIESALNHFWSDCVNWGGGGGAGPGEQGQGYPAFMLGGVPPGKAGRRSIGLGCPTLLEVSDRTFQGQNDFFPATLNPRNNASPITETPCNAPQSGINSATVKEGETTSSTSVRIAFSAAKLADSTFECKLDGGAFTPCTSPVEYTGLKGDDLPNGTAHKFEVRASNANGVEQTPATLSWTVNTNLSMLSSGGGSAAAATSAVAGPAAPSAAPAAKSAPAQRATAKKKAKKRRAKKHRRAAQKN